MNGFLYTLTFEEPILVASLGGDPNSAQSLSYIPGGAVRGAFIQAFTGKMDAENDGFRRLFLNGDTRYLNAYPLVNGERSLPTPLTWQKKRKSEDKTVYEVAPDGVETESVKFRFWAMKDANLLSVEEDRQVNVHTQRDAALGRSTSDAGTVYQYVALPAGMRFQGIVLTQTKKDADTLNKSIKDNKIILLGKARTAGYGAAQLDVKPLPKNWQEWTPAGGLDGEVTLTLLSPAIVRDAAGQYTLDLTEALKARLGKKIQVSVKQRRGMLIGGFNRTWGLPLPQMNAIAAGSVFSITGADKNKLQELAQTGFGERRAEGFGQVALNLRLPEDNMLAQDTEIDQVSLESEALKSDNPLARQMLERLMQRDLDEQTIRAARALAAGYKGGLPNSQISRWRVLLRDALPNKELKRVGEFCEKAKGKPGWKKMEKARLSLGGGKTIRLTEWIESMLADAGAWKNTWAKDFNPKRKIGTVSLTAEAFADEYRLRLIDAVLAVMSKENVNADTVKAEKGGAND